MLTFIKAFVLFFSMPKPLKPHITNAGYPAVTLCKNKKKYSKSDHRLVLETFGKNYQTGKECNHKNGIKSDNRIENLEWVTRAENHSHAFRIGLRSHKGENHNNAKLKDGEVWLIKKLLKSGLLTQKYISKMFNVSRGCIKSIKIGHTWTHIKGD